MRRTAIAVTLLAACEATFVVKVKNADATLLRRIADVDCQDCGTDHGKVDMWDPDEVHASEVHDTWTGDVDVRGAHELQAFLAQVQPEFEYIHADFEEVARAERERIAKRLGNVPANATADDWYRDYHPYSEINARLQYFQRQFGVEYFSIGNTFLGNAINGIRFGSPARNQSIWIQCGIHAREWIAPATCMYFTEKLLDLRNSDPVVAAILAQTEVYMIPVLNRDGYQYSWAAQSQRLWRKNRQTNTGSTAVGTDLNRNWAASWGGCGASTNPSDDTYRGTAAFSAPEAARVRDYIARLRTQGRQIIGGHDFHSYGNLLLRPYGYTANDAPNENAARTLGASMVQAIRQNSGQVYQNQKAFQLYCASGLACDWLSTQSPSAYTFELRGTSFTLPPAQIIPSGEEIYAAMIVWFRSVVRV